MAFSPGFILKNVEEPGLTVPKPSTTSSQESTAYLKPVKLIRLPFSSLSPVVVETCGEVEEVPFLINIEIPCVKVIVEGAVILKRIETLSEKLFV